MIINLTTKNYITNNSILNKIKQLFKFENFYQSTETFLNYKMLYILDSLPINTTIKESFVLFINPTLENIEELNKCNNKNIIVYLFSSINVYNSTYQNNIFLYENCVILNWDNSDTKMLFNILDSFYKSIYNINCSIENCDDNGILKDIIVNSDMYDIITIFHLFSEMSKTKYKELLSGRLLEIFETKLNEDGNINQTSLEVLEAYKRTQSIFNKYTYIFNEYKYINLLKITNYFKD